VIDLAAVLRRVPSHERFRSWAEIRAGTAALVREFPGRARLETVGGSTEGRPIDLLTVGYGRRRLLLIARPIRTSRSAP
jgi:hypothetical protein